MPREDPELGDVVLRPGISRSPREVSGLPRSNTTTNCWRRTRDSRNRSWRCISPGRSSRSSCSAGTIPGRQGRIVATACTCTCRADRWARRSPHQHSHRRRPRKHRAPRPRTQRRRPCHHQQRCLRRHQAQHRTRSGCARTHCTQQCPPRPEAGQSDSLRRLPTDRRRVDHHGQPKLTFTREPAAAFRSSQLFGQSATFAGVTLLS